MLMEHINCKENNATLEKEGPVTIVLNQLIEKRREFNLQPISFLLRKSTLNRLNGP